MRNSKKSQYIEIKERVIYILLSSQSKEFFIGHCRKDLLKSVFQDHYYGERYQTEACFSSLRNQKLHPCLFILEEVTTTKVEAYNYVIVWTKIFHEAGYKNLNQGSIVDYFEDLMERNFIIYNERKNAVVSNIIRCSKCIVSTYKRQKCPLFKGDDLCE